MVLKDSECTTSDMYVRLAVSLGAHHALVSRIRQGYDEAIIDTRLHVGRENCPKNVTNGT